MAEEKKSKFARAVLVEFDFTAIKGAEILYEVARKRLGDCGIDLTPKLEAIHLVNGNCQGALAEILSAFGKKHDPAKAAHELLDTFKARLTAVAKDAVTPEFKAFVKAAVDKGLKVVIATRSDIEALKPAFAEFDEKNVVLYAEPSHTYGNCKWDAWRRAVRTNGLHEMITVAVSGSGYGVKSALIAGMPVIAMPNAHVAYQDFGGADVAVDGFSADLVNEVLRMLHLAD